MQTSSCSYFCAVLSSITAVWNRMYASSHSHSSAIHYSTLATDRHFLPLPQCIEHHITTVSHNCYSSSHISAVQFCKYLCHKLYFVLFFFSGIRRLWCNKALNCLCISPQSCVAILFARKVLANRGATILSIQCLTLNFNTRSPAYRFHCIQVSF